MNPFNDKSVKLRLRRLTATREWIVRVFIDDQPVRSADYYTDDRQDAVDTLNAMANRYNDQGYTVL